MTPDNRRPGIPISRRGFFTALGAAAGGAAVAETVRFLQTPPVPRVKPTEAPVPPTRVVAVDTRAPLTALPTALPPTPIRIEATPTVTEYSVIKSSDIKGMSILIDDRIKISLLTPDKQKVGNYHLDENDPTLKGNARITRIDGDPVFSYAIYLDNCLLPSDTDDHISVRPEFWGIGTQPVSGRRDLSSNKICAIINSQNGSGITLFVAKPSAIVPENFINVIPTTQDGSKPTHIKDAHPIIYIDRYAKDGERTSSVWFEGKDLVKFPQP